MFIFHSKVKLSDALLSSFQLKKVKDYEVGWMDALVTMDSTKGDRDLGMFCLTISKLHVYACLWFHDHSDKYHF